LWKPLLRWSDDEWVGVTDDAGIWVGTGQAARARVDLENPVFLWPLLERSRLDVLAELRGVWIEFSNKGVRSPEDLVEAIVTSAVRGSQPYWIDLAMGWMQGMEKESGYHIENFRVLLLEISESRIVGQANRHKAQKILRAIARSA
jgi:hypothetical protein